jgi:hypothetical protein
MSDYKIEFQGGSDFGSYVFRRIPVVEPPKSVYPHVRQYPDGWFFAVFEVGKVERWPCYHGRYSTASRAYFAACRYAYGPIPRDFRPEYPKCIGLEGLFDSPCFDSLQE